ncbi:MAG: hypothetical protein NTV86_06210 [Planctomycetota bacterium]|nr:hypothetical protein [Planctomycetota bacterium]
MVFDLEAAGEGAVGLAGEGQEEDAGGVETPDGVGTPVVEEPLDLVVDRTNALAGSAGEIETVDLLVNGGGRGVFPG